MSKDLELARQQAEAGDCKAAARTLERVEVLARHDIDDARGLLELATSMRDKAGRRVRKDCDILIFKAERIIASYEADHASEFAGHV